MDTQSQNSVDMLQWMWGNPKLGTLGTVIQSDGTVRQLRRHPSDLAASECHWGRVSSSQAREVIELSRNVLAFGSDSETVERIFPPEREFVEARVRTADREVVLRIDIAELGQHPDMQRLRDAVVRVRKQVSGGGLSWRSIGGRVALLLVVLMGLMSWWIVRDWRESSRMEQSAERLDARMIESHGRNGYDPAKFIIVRFTPKSGKRTDQKIEQYLSAENWQAARVGTTVRIWHDTASGHTYLENDIQRWNRDKKWIPLLPIGIAIPILIVCLCLAKYRVGVHSDGQEYLIRDDYVVADDRNAIVNRTTYNMGRLIWWLAK